APVDARLGTEDVEPGLDLLDRGGDLAAHLQGGRGLSMEPREGLRLLRPSHRLLVRGEGRRKVADVLVRVPQGLIQGYQLRGRGFERDRVTKAGERWAQL